MLVRPAHVYRFMDFQLDDGAGELRGRGRTLTLSRQQLALLRALLRARGRTVGREVLLREVWSGAVVSEGALRQALSELRKLLGPEGEHVIEAVRGRGYRMVCAVTVESEPSATDLPRRSYGARLIGRDRELGELDRLRCDALEHSGRACLLVGPAGVGKSRLAGELAELAALEGIAFVESYCDRDGSLPPLWPFMRVLEACLHDARRDVRTRCQALAPGVFDWLDASGSRERPTPLDEPSERRVRFFDQLARALSLLLKEAPRVCVLEDVQWADEASLAFLAHYARALGQGRALWIFTCRSSGEGQSPALARALLALEHAPHNRRLVLTSLARAETAALLGDQLGSAVPDALADEVHAITEGNPLFVLELCRALREGAVVRDALTPALDTLALQPVLERRVARLSRAALDALQVAAVLGRAVTVIELAALVGRPEAEVSRCIDECLQSGILSEASGQGFWFAHPLFQQTTYGMIPYGERCALHGRVARWLEAMPEVERPRRLSELAYHFQRAGHGEHLRKALHYARKAGRAALAATAYSTAADHFEQAARCAHLLSDCPPGERIALELSRVEALHAHQGLTPALRAEYLELAERARLSNLGELFARATLGYAGHQHARFVPARFAASADPRERSMLEHALAELPPEARELRVLTLCFLAYALGATGETERRRALLRDALEQARATGDAALIARVLQVKLFAAAGADFATAMLPTCDEWVEITLQHGFTELELEARIARFLWRTCRVEHAAAAQDAERAKQLADLIGTERAKSRAELPALLAAFGEGRLDEVERLAERARAAAPDDPNQQIIHMVRVATIATLRGHANLAQAASVYEIMLAANPHAVNLRAMLSTAYASLGRCEAAVRELDAVIADDFAALPDNIHWLPTVALLAEAAVCLGDVERARIIYRALLPYADLFFFFGVETTPGAAVALWLSDLSIVVGELESAEAFLDRADAVHAALGLTMLDQYAALVRARLLLAKRGPHAPRQIRPLLKRVRQFALERQLGWLVARADDLEARIGAPRREVFELGARGSASLGAHDDN